MRVIILTDGRRYYLATRSFRVVPSQGSYGRSLLCYGVKTRLLLDPTKRDVSLPDKSCMHLRDDALDNTMSIDYKQDYTCPVFPVTARTLWGIKRIARKQFGQQVRFERSQPQLYYV